VIELQLEKAGVRLAYLFDANLMRNAIRYAGEGGSLA